MKYSKQRNLINEIILNTSSHPTAEWIHDQAKKQMPNIGIATIYRNLHTLVQNGDIIRIPVQNHSDRYDGRVEEHYHMQCENCGKLFDLTTSDNENLKALKELIGKTFAGVEENYRLNNTLMHGCCNECRP